MPSRLCDHVYVVAREPSKGVVMKRHPRPGVRARIERGGKIGAELKMTDTVKRCAFAMFRMGASTRDVAKAIGVTTATVYVHFPGGPAKWRKR